VTLNFPNRFVWLMIGAIILFLLQSGCQPIQPPTPAVTATADEERSRADLSTNITTETPSPNGAWIATTLFQVALTSETYYQNLTVTHASGAPSYIVVAREGPFGLGYTVAEPLMWSADGERFYYTNSPQADGCGLFFNGSDLHRLDLATGDTTELLPANATTTLALAPDENHVAFLTMGRLALILHDLTRGESTSFDLSPLLEQDENEARPQAGAFVWSPDSNALTIVVAHNPCSGAWAASTSLYVLDVPTLSLTEYLNRDDRVLSAVAWPTTDTITLENQVAFDQLDQKRTYTLDLTTNVIAPAADQ
jgi:hypothetical protein